ncbi:MerR family transcriptional regulator [Streptococcus saliviloxodontae]|uniref:DNA-binding transcriptional MerR regulator/DNA-directed RNA polymerase subunit RPC12/RpoP n=1 Tax=Streptococcus saliviloxodontae TaxID=1349416 RepID=A0ABS2PKQ4_9STRE|nr:MerR family transcriptional regulator [Streptococcus saliviloxodontae]MBM7636018.1 DNA-binding transcriptional MerR regulator/DNA-directed RNA polymerase subunit RPC12/RpoP [Streptococcus saliviloxodontae]
MSQSYSTGEVAKLAGVTVRTVQYYDQKGILRPSRVSEGGRRIYSQADLQQLQVIVFLRDLDFSLEQIRYFLADASSEKTLDLLLREQVRDLKTEIASKKAKLDRVVNLLDATKHHRVTSSEALADISLTMTNQKAWKKLQWKMYLILAAEVVSYALAVFTSTHFNLRWLLWAAVLTFVVGFNVSVIYFRRQFIYLCPNCHQTFEPSFKEFAIAGHTPRTRRLTCPHCHEKSYCLELAKESK